MYKLKEDIVFTKHKDGTTVLLSLLDTENSYFKVTGLSQDIFDAICAGIDLKQVRNDILSKYEVDEKTLDNDINTFVTYLKDNQIIEDK